MFQNLQNGDEYEVYNVPFLLLKLTLTKLTNTLTQQTKLTVKNNHIAGVKNWAHLYHYEQILFLQLRDFGGIFGIW